MLLKIISGGQTGVDQGGLRAAKLLGIATGGWMPRGFRTLSGPRPDLAQEFGLREHTSSKYPPRTAANVGEADATIRFARNFQSAGERCTFQAIQKLRKPYLDIPTDEPLNLALVREWLRQHRIVALNVAGNTEKQAPGIELFVIDYLVKALGPVA